MLALSLAASLTGLVQPWITKLIIDDGLLAGNYDMVLGLCAVMFAAAIAGAGLAALNRWHYVTVSGRVLFALRAAVYRHLETLSPAYFAASRTGDLVTRLDGDVAEIQRFSIDTALALINAVIVLIGALVLMMLMNWQLSLVAFCLLPLQVIVLKWLRPRVEASTRTVRERSSLIASFLYDTLSAMKLIQSTGNTEREARRLEHLQDTQLVDLRRLQMINQAAAALPSLLTLTATIAVFLIGGWMVIAKTLTLGTLVAFTAYLARATGPVHTLLGLWVALKRAEVSLARVHEMLSVAPAVASSRGGTALDATGDIVLEDVHFTYPGTGHPVLSGLTARLPAGGKTVIVGASGAGKTTIVDLLQRHFDPDAGRILIAGTDLRDADLDVLRRAVAVVAQDTTILPGSIADNIRYANADASEAEVRDAARRAGAATFIHALPAGYETDVGSRGLKLSGGQRQRIALARALLQAPSILILDEATSGVDSATEKSIALAVDQLFAGRTRIVIAHRSTLTEAANNVLELVDGRIMAREPEPSR